MIKSQYIRSFGIVTFYNDRPFTVSPHSDEGIDLFPNENEYSKKYQKVGNMICDRCKNNTAMHTFFCLLKNSTRKTPMLFLLCCSCHIAMGGIPADWHPLCVQAANKKIP